MEAIDLGISDYGSFDSLVDFELYFMNRNMGLCRAVARANLDSLRNVKYGKKKRMQEVTDNEVGELAAKMYKEPWKINPKSDVGMFWPKTQVNGKLPGETIKAISD